MKFAQRVRSLDLQERVGVREGSGARRHFIVRGGSARPMIVRRPEGPTASRHRAGHPRPRQPAAGEVLPARGWPGSRSSQGAALRVGPGDRVGPMAGPTSACKHALQDLASRYTTESFGAAVTAFKGDTPEQRD